MNENVLKMFMCQCWFTELRYRMSGLLTAWNIHKSHLNIA